MSTKSCNKCEKRKALGEFNKNLSKSDKLQDRCRVCDQKLARKYYHTRYRKQQIARAKAREKAMRQWIENYKKAHECLICADSRFYVLDFHHRDRATKQSTLANIARRGWSLARVREEIAKCDLLCANCHRELHYFERTNS